MQFVLELLSQLILEGLAELIRRTFGRRGCILVLVATIVIGVVAWQLRR